MNPDGLFSNQTFIDFEVNENSQALGTFLSTYFRSELVIGNASGTQTHCVPDRPPYVVFNKLEGYGYKVVAANSQRPTGASVYHGSTGVSYTVWTLHKPL